MNLYSYIASMNPRKANVLLRNNGFGEGKTTSEIEARLKQYVREEREEAMREVAKIHPDKELLIGDGVSAELLNYTGRERHRNFNGQEFLQDLDTTTYYGPNAAQNPYRPIAPDYFNNAIGANQEQFPMNKSANAGITKEDLQDVVKTAVIEAKASDSTPKQASVLSFSQQEVVMMLGFAFLGYLIAKKGL